MVKKILMPIGPYKQRVALGRQPRMCKTSLVVKICSLSFRTCLHIPFFCGLIFKIYTYFVCRLAAHEGRWYLFLAEHTRIHFTILGNSLANFDPSEELFLGHALSDQEHTITHHFAPPHSLRYPHFASGFLLSAPALLK